MSSIYDILNINMDLIRGFPLTANQSSTIQVDNMVKHNIRKLEEIGNSIHIEDTVPSPININEIFDKVRWYSRQKEQVHFSMRELRIVSYYMVKLQGDTISYDYAIDLLRTNWKNIYFRGLVYYVLNSWNSLYKEYRIKVCELIREKLSEYHGDNRRYCLLKDHADYFDEGGPLRMSKLVVAKEMDLFNAPQIIGYKDSSFTLSFYSDVILHYLKDKKYDLTLVETILKKHDLDRTKKLIFSNLVRIAAKQGNESYQTRICKLANSLLGDVTKSDTWMPFIGATKEEVEELRNAKEWVNLWFTKKIIETFFDICVQDKRRKNFWLKYATWINDFKIFGSTLIKIRLQANGRIGDMLKRFFVEINSRQSQNAALALCIKGKVLIEFSDVGRLYVYDICHPIVKKIKSSRQIESIEDLKRPEMNKLIDFQRNSMGGYHFSNYEDEGHMNHSGDWEVRLESWISNKLENDDTYISFTKTNDNETFQERPIPVENFTLKEPEEKIDLELIKQVKVIFQSESFFDDKKYKIVADKDGFYIYIERKGGYIFIKPFKTSEYIKGNILINKLNTEYSYEIIYDDSGKLHIIGYIKKSGDRLIFKEKIDNNKQLEIKVD